MTQLVKPKINFIFASILLISMVLTYSSMCNGATKSRVYAVVVANNHSLDEGFAPLRYADDDGAKYFELFTAAGVDVKLLSVLDPDSANRFKHAAHVARPPKKDEVLDTISRMFESIREDKQNGIQTEFIFVFSGHGNVGPNQEGYINFLDKKFTRSELFSEIIAKSPATFNHIILDACHAYYLVEKKGGKPDKTGDFRNSVYDFLKSEELASYPNTGVILASSKESESHEWSRWEAGIFSHELRSAILGSADVNGDGAITYAEAAACVEAANATIEVPKARLRVHYRAPAINAETPLFNLTRFAGASRIKVGKEMAGRYQVEDERGVRIADFHFSDEQDIEIYLVGQEPFFIKNDEQEAEIEIGTTFTQASSLSFAARSADHKGSVERSFRHHLYEVPFGLGFYHGVTASNDPGGSTLPAPVTPTFDIDSYLKATPLKKWGLSTVGFGMLLGIASGITYYSAFQSHEEYEDANPTNVNQLKQEAQNKVLASRILLGTGIAVAATGITMIIIDSRKKDSSSVAAGPVFVPIEDGLMLGVAGRW